MQNVIIEHNVGQNSEVGIAPHFSLDRKGTNLGGGEIFHTCPAAACFPPNLLHNGKRLFPGVKELGCGVNHTPPSSTKVKERVKLYL